MPNIEHNSLVCLAGLHTRLYTSLIQWRCDHIALCATAVSVLCMQVCPNLKVFVSAVTDMFYDQPYNLGRNNDKCFRQFGVDTQYDWSAST